MLYIVQIGREEEKENKKERKIPYRHQMQKKTIYLNFD